jgi:hypothetical protein
MKEMQKMRKLQWAKLVEEKKAKLIADRQKHIEEEQAKIMEQSIASTKAVSCCIDILCVLTYF